MKIRLSMSATFHQQVTLLVLFILAVMASANTSQAQQWRGFPSKTGPAAGDSTQGVTTGDFNGNGITDIATANEGAGTVSVLLGNGDGTFAAAVNYAVGDSPWSVTTGDFNGNGITDIVTANEDSGNVSVLLGKGDGTFAAAVNYDVGASPRCVTTGDFNGN
ncbi:MAG: VCBS repeat-containing protein, partial [Candidatus Sumerlaeia bacterium]|nr:VCBS repeat-containing protein [Candidatus Sumerlaeia bacterium]